MGVNPQRVSASTLLRSFALNWRSMSYVKAKVECLQLLCKYLPQIQSKHFRMHKKEELIFLFHLHLLNLGLSAH